jgi:hypothetical protein
MQGVGLQAGGPTVQDFSLLHSVQTDSGTRPASYPIGTAGSYTGVKRQKREADHSPPSSTDVKKGRAVPPLRICLHAIMHN